MDNRGFLSLQYLIINDDGETCYVEYLVGDFSIVCNLWILHGYVRNLSSTEVSISWSVLYMVVSVHCTCVYYIVNYTLSNNTCTPNDL